MSKDSNMYKARKPQIERNTGGKRKRPYEDDLQKERMQKIWTVYGKYILSIILNSNSSELFASIFVFICCSII